MTLRHTTRSRARRGFSLVEMLIAMTISATLLTAALAALDSMFKGYKQTTESASTHVVSRIVMNRLLGLIRTGEEFGPFPADVLDTSQNPVVSETFEMVTARDSSGTITEITRIEYRAPEIPVTPDPEGGEEGEEGDADVETPVATTGQLWYVLVDPNGGSETILAEQPLLDGVRSATFTLHYDIGPRLHRATIDLVIEPNDDVDITIGTDSVPQTIRMVASASPRQSLTNVR